jgi:hypothetical protein
MLFILAIARIEASAAGISRFFYSKKYGLSTRKKITAMQVAMLGMSTIKMMKLAQ